MTKSNKRNFEEVMVVQEFSSDELDSDTDVYADSEDGIYYEDDIVGGGDDSIKKEFCYQGHVAIETLIGSAEKKGKKQLFPDSNGVFLHVTYKLPLKMDVRVQGCQRYL